jgi:hypothetical protein
MNTILPTKVEEEFVMTTNDEAYDKLAKDKSVTQVPENSKYEQLIQKSFKFEKTENLSSNQTNLTQSATSNSASNAEVLVANTEESWINKKWRPMMAWTYMSVCISDFIVFPVLWSILQAAFNGQVTNQWQPLTLMGAGLFHVAMGAVLGIAVYGRTKEKLDGKITP